MVMHLLATAKVALAECSLHTKVLCLLLCVLYLTSFTEYGMKHLPVVPGFLFPPNFAVWTLLTSPFFNFHLAFLFSDIATVFLVEKLLLPLWGWKETIKFGILVQASTVLLCTFYCYLCYIVSAELFFLYKASICGLLPILGGLSVACRQMMPDNILLSLPLGKFRNKHLSFFLCVVLALFSLFYHIGLHVFLILFGIYTSWIYLRFFQIHANGMKGDRGDGFTFASFFPNHLEPPIAVCSNALYALLIKLKICKPVDRHYNLDNPSHISLTIKSGGDPGDLERRKLIALKALNMRLSEMDTVSSWPSMEQEDAPPAKASTLVTSVKPESPSSNVTIVEVNTPQPDEPSPSIITQSEASGEIPPV